MSQDKGIVFIIGGGPRIGHAVAKAFSNDGYKVAIASRKPDENEAEKNGWLAVAMDVTDERAVDHGFQQVCSQLGSPNMVIYNAAALTPVPFEDPFSLTTEQYMADLQINLTGGYSCLRNAVLAFKECEKSLPKVFIATGNVVPFRPFPPAMTLGSGKAALVHLIQVANAAYGPQGFRFYFASQITDKGGPVPYQDVDAEAHGRQYSELAKRTELGEWDVRFV